MVRYRYLHTDHRRNQDDIALYTSGQGGRRVTIGTGQSVHGHALFGQGASFCDQIFHTAGYAIGSQKSDYRGNTIFEEFTELGFRYTGCRTLLSAAACDMHVHVNVSRNNGLSLQIIGFHSRKSLISLNSILHQKDFFPLNKDIFLSQFLRCVHIRVFQ